MHTAAFIRKCLTGIALTLFLPPLAASAQPGNARKASASESGASQTYRLFTGRVEDAATGKPLSYASVSLLHSTLSNIANSEGVFTLKIPDAESGAEDSLLVSHLGYRSRKVPAGAAGGRRPAVIRLEPSSISLNTITIRPEEALRLFQLAFSERKIRENYPQQTRGLTGFYREIIKRGNRFATLNEAVLDIAKAPYAHIGTDQIAIYRGRGSRNIRVTDTLVMRLQGGPVSALYVDLMKHPFAGTDLLMAPHYYDFWMGPALYGENSLIYSVEFNQRDSVPGALYNGKLFIDSESAAVVRAEFSLNTHRDPDSWKYFVRRKPSEVKIGVDYAHYAVNYKKHEDKWYPDYLRMELKFNVTYQGKRMKNQYLIVSELAITDIDNSLAFNMDTRSKVRYRDEMAEKVNQFTDADFWENYNIIEPDESIDNIIRLIIRQLRRRKNSPENRISPASASGSPQVGLQMPD